MKAGSVRRRCAFHGTTIAYPKNAILVSAACLRLQAEMLPGRQWTGRMSASFDGTLKALSVGITTTRQARIAS